MAKVYTATLEVQCWKEHTCHGCGGVYAYELRRRVQGQGDNSETASQRAERAAMAAANREVDIHPCPTCGLVQPDMIGHARVGAAGLVFVGALLAFVAIAVGIGADIVRAHESSTLFALVCVAAALLLLATQARNFNADLGRNREVARGRVRSGRIRAEAPGRTDAPAARLARPGWSIGKALCFAFLLAAPVAAASPEIVRAQHGWPSNDECLPPFVGPGDRAEVRMEQSVTSLNGFWRGQPEVKVSVGGKPLPQRVNGFAVGARGWSKTISAKAKDANSEAHPTFAFSIPADEGLAGKRLAVEVDADVEYPAAAPFSKSFDSSRTHVHQVFAIQLASEPGAGALFQAAWSRGTWGAVALTLLGALGLRGAARRMERRRTATRLYR